ncbi:putative plasma membrane ferric-chelate reductase, partial [Aureobasidium melanogenum]
MLLTNPRAPLPAALAAISTVLLLTYLYFHASLDAGPHLLSIKASTQPAQLSQCPPASAISNIVLSIKTGATEAFEKLPTQLLTILQCADTLLLFSDLEQDIHSLHIHDVLSRYNPDFLAHHADFELYRKQKEYQAEGRDIQTLSTMKDSNSDWRTAGHNAAWALDKYKFLHMIERAWELQPDKDWYVFAETDTYIVWRNLMQWLQRFDPSEPLYLGRGEPMKKEEGDGFYFAHGGSGFVLSRAAMYDFCVTKKGLASRWDARIPDLWFGDYVVAKALKEELDLNLTSAAPMFSGHKPMSLPIGAGIWCRPVITQHHLRSEEVQTLWMLEDQFYTNSSTSSLPHIRFSHLFRDILSGVKFPELRSEWDNLSQDNVYTVKTPRTKAQAHNKPEERTGEPTVESDPNSSPDACHAACEVVETCFHWDEKSQQLWRYVADRTGIMAYATLPLIWTFAGRNNVLTWATVLAIVHSAVYTWLFVEFEGWGMFRREFTQLWLLLGVVATVTMCLLLLFSVSWLRIKFYEIFLVLHILLSVVTLVGCFLHTSIFDARYDAYLWPIVIVWLLDRALRLLRLIACNIHVRLGKQVINRTRSIASYSKESDVIRLDIRTSSFLAQPAAGQFYYLYQPSTWQGYENHPFTLGAWSSQSSASEDADTYLLQHDDLPNEFDQSDFGSKYQSTVQNLTFWIRPYDGWTRRLRDECFQSTEGIMEPTILLEGPYGHHCHLSSFDSVLLIAGGTGIASAVPYILEHMALSKAGKSDTTHMHLLWTVRQAYFIKEVFGQELRTAAQRDDFSADLFCTRQSEGPKHGEEQQPRGEENEYLRSRLQYGRPDIAAAIAKAATRGEKTGTKVAVLVCGPPAMADEARLAVHRSLKHGCHGLEYFEESFGCVIASIITTFPWADLNAWAGQIIARNNKSYMYLPMRRRGGNMAIGVAVANSITGPWKDAIGKPLLENGRIDPTVWIDDNGQAYLYFANPGLFYVKLNPDMISHSGSIVQVPTSVASFGSGREPDGTTFAEGPWIYKRNNMYYLVYAANCCSEDIRYSTGPSITGPWTYHGIVMASAGNSFTNHPAIIDFKGKSYFFYHNGALPGGSGYTRSIAVEAFAYNSDGTIPLLTMTNAGAPQIGTLNPYTRNEAETMAFSSGIQTQAMTEGGIAIVNIENGDYVKVAGVAFGNGAKSFSARIASATNGGKIELRLGSVTGTLVGTCNVPGTNQRMADLADGILCYQWSNWD